MGTPDIFLQSNIVPAKPEHRDGFYVFVLMNFKKRARSSPDVKGLSIYDERIKKYSLTDETKEDPLYCREVWIYTAKTKKREEA